MGTVASITRTQPKAIRHLAQRLPAHKPWFHVSGAQHAASFQLSPPMRLTPESPARVLADVVACGISWAVGILRAEPGAVAGWD
jgi:hypothetical protein